MGRHNAGVALTFKPGKVIVYESFPSIGSPAVKVKIEGVVTCVNNADFLAHTLPTNRSLFDRLVIVTAPEDKATQRVCDAWNVQHVQTDAFRSRWGEFCKGAGINVGLSLLDRNAWLIHMDADILLPPHARDVIEQSDLDTSMIYGIDRYEFKSYADYQQFISSPEPQTRNMFVHTSNAGENVRIGTRISFKHYNGYLPIGFFQLWHSDSGIMSYPEGHTTAAREDVLFPAQWPRRKRGFLPELIAYHLESEEAPMAVNWAGRKTKPFRLPSRDSRNRD